MRKWVLERQINKLRQQAKLLRKKTLTGTEWKQLTVKRQPQTNLITKLEEINQKKEDCKGTNSVSNNTDKTGHSKMTKKEFVKSEESQINNPRQKETKQFWCKIWRRKERNGNVRGENDIKKN